MNSIPAVFAEMGFGFDAYKDLARNVNRVLNMQSKWDGILKRANSELSGEAILKGQKLPMIMAHDREFFAEAGLNYAEGIPVQGCFTVAVADYLLRNKAGLNL